MTVIKNSTGVLHDAEAIIPSLGMTGIYSLKTPYTSVIKPDIEYTCISITSIAAAEASGIDVLNDIYKAVNDTEESYNTARDKNAALITLQSSKGDVVTIPNAALNSLPGANGINYNSVMLGVSLSIIPEFLDLSDISIKIHDIVFKTLGVESTVYPIVMGGSIMLSHSKHEAIENARVSNLDETSNTLLENERLKEQVQALINQKNLLEAYIKTNVPPPPTQP